MVTDDYKDTLATTATIIEVVADIAQSLESPVSETVQFNADSVYAHKVASSLMKKLAKYTTSAE